MSTKTAYAINMLISVLVNTRVFQAQYEEWHALLRGDRTLANAWVWWGMKACFKRKIGAVAGGVGRGQHYRGNAADQIQHQPAGDAQYEVLIKEFARGHSNTQKTISNQQNQINRPRPALRRQRR